MTHTILKSRLSASPEDIALAVKLHAQELEQWTENMRLYDEEQKNPPPPEPQRDQFETDEAYTAAYVEHGELMTFRRQKYPPPSAHPEIDAAVARSEQDGRRLFTPDYTIVDDLKPEDLPQDKVPELLRLKEVYLSRVIHAEQEAMKTILPHGKVRAYQLREAGIRQADAARDAPVQKEISGLEESNPKRKSLQVQLADPSRHDKVRPKEDTQFLVSCQTIREAQLEVSRKAAAMMSDIEDLTEDNVRSWTLGSF
jgi:hypothetical protein